MSHIVVYIVKCFLDLYSNPLYDLGVSGPATPEEEDNGIEHWAYFQVPGDFPISAASAAFLAFSLAIRALGAGPSSKDKATIVTDCAAVVAGFDRPHKHFGYRFKYAGMWRESGLGDIAQVENMAAHLTQAQANDRILGHH